MAELIKGPAIVEAAGNKPKQIQEYIGRANSETGQVSIARMISPEGWEESGQTPEFDEYTVVLSGTLQVKTRQETFQLKTGQAIIVEKGEWVQYSTPEEGGAEYMAVCLPAFSPELVNRDTF